MPNPYDQILNREQGEMALYNQMKARGWNMPDAMTQEHESNIWKDLNKRMDPRQAGYEETLGDVDAGLQKYVTNPLTEAGFPNLGAGLGAIGSGATEMLMPGPYEGIIGAGPKVPKVVDFSAFKNTGKIQAKRGRPHKQEPFKPSRRSDVPAQAIPENEHPIDRAQRIWADEKNHETWIDEMSFYDKAGHDEPWVHQFQTAWGPQLPKGMRSMVPVRNVTDLKGHLGKDVAKGGADPFAWIDHKYKVTKSALEKNYDKPLTISTRSDLIGHDDYMELINPKLHKIEMHVGGDNNRFVRVTEPGNPSVLRRMKAVQKLQDSGYDVTIVLDKFDNISDEVNSINQFDDLYKEFFRNGGKMKTNNVGKMPARVLKGIDKKWIKK